MSPAPHLPERDPRRAELARWLAGLPPPPALDPQTLRAASSDASFRRYFRVDGADAEGAAAASWIVMDAPPSHEDCRPFVHVAGLLAGAGVNAPAVVQSDLERGFLLLSDLGDLTYAGALAAGRHDVQALYGDALAALLRMQGIAVDKCGLPDYDHGRLLAEMQLFPEWYVHHHLGVELSGDESLALAEVFERLADRALAQGRVFVHRDFHCRNLMVVEGGDSGVRPGGAEARVRIEGGNPGVLDFQDAVIGAPSYDLVSLLRDAYVEWPEAQQIDWAARYWNLARRAGIPVPASFDAFWQDLEWMGLQRTLKVLGIFARLSHRDGKDRYLSDLPLVLRHTRAVARRYDALAPLARLLDRLHGTGSKTGLTF